MSMSQKAEQAYLKKWHDEYKKWRASGETQAVTNTPIRNYYLKEIENGVK